MIIKNKRISIFLALSILSISGILLAQENQTESREAQLISKTISTDSDTTPICRFGVNADAPGACVACPTNPGLAEIFEEDLF